MSSFDRLSPALKYHIVNTLGWPDLRPVQILTIDTVLSGRNCVVLAPTAGGKTEAGLFPLLSAMDHNDWRPVSTIYLSPIKALLNNQEAASSIMQGSSDVAPSNGTVTSARARARGSCANRPTFC